MAAAEREMRDRLARRPIGKHGNYGSGPVPVIAGAPPGAGIAVPDLRFESADPDPVALIRMVIDSAVAIACLLGTLLAFGGTFSNQYVILAMLVFSLTFPGNRRLDVRDTRRLAGHVLRNWLLVCGLLLLLGWSTGTLSAFDRSVMLTWVLVTPPVLLLAHRLIPALLTRMQSAKALQRRAVILGGGELGCRLAERIRANPLLGIAVDGFFDDRNAERLPAAAANDLLGGIDDLPTYVNRHGIDIVYGTLPQTSDPRVRRLIEDLKDTTASIYFVPDVLPFELIQARMDSISGMPVLAVRETPYQGVNGIVKRLSDVVIASLLLVLASPLMLAVAAAVKVTSPGPVLFKQRRYGLDGREIVVYKFRTMTCTEDGDDIRQATKDDQRTTRIGAFLRKYSLDELPQLVNVLQGRMSVVGPRPHAVAHNEMYRKLIRGYMLRHKVTPGITGLAQVEGLRGETDTVEKMQARIQRDIDYLRNWSLLFDLQIILRTVGAVLGRQNAY